MGLATYLRRSPHKHLFFCMAQVVVYFTIPFMTGCISVPKAAPELSMELGKRIVEIEKSHLHLLHSYMDEKRTRVEEFIEKEWIPEFAGEFMQEDLIRDTWNQVCSTGSDEDRLKFLIIIGRDAQVAINNKRQELIAPLDQVEREIDRKLSNEYAQAKAINVGITGFLSSASEVEQARKDVLGMFGINDQDIVQGITIIESAVDKLTKITGKTEDVLTRTEEYKDKIEDAINKLKGK